MSAVNNPFADWLRDFRQQECAHSGALGPLCCSPCLRDRIIASEWFSQQIADAEQRGREDNSDHGMCYVHGSDALEAHDRQIAAQSLRSVATTVDGRVTTPLGKPSRIDIWLRRLAASIEKGAHCG